MSVVRFLMILVPLLSIDSAMSQTITIQDEGLVKAGRIYSAPGVRDEHLPVTTLSVSRGNVEHRSLISFDLSAIPEGTTVKDAVVMLFVQKQYHGNPIKIGMYPVAESWDPDLVTWNSRGSMTAWGTAGGSFTPTLLGSADLEADFGNGWIAFRSENLVRQINRWRSGEPNHGVILKSEFHHSGPSISVFAATLTEFDADDPTTPKLICSVDGELDLAEHGYISPDEVMRRPLREMVRQVETLIPEGAGQLRSTLDDVRRSIGQLRTQDGEQASKAIEEQILKARREVMRRLWPETQVKIWRLGPWEPLDKLALPAAEAPVIEEDMLGDAYAEASFAVTNLTDGEIDLHVTLGKSGGDFEQAVTLRATYWVEAQPVDTSRGTAASTWIDDALPLLPDDGTLTLSAGETRRVWLTIDSHQLSAGLHEAVVSIISPTADEASEVPVRVNVASQKLARDPDLHVFTYGYLNRPSTTDLREFALADMKAHYQNTFVLNLYPDVKVDESGSVVVPPDFSAIESYLSLIPDAKKILFFWHWDGDGSRATFGRRVKFGSSEWERALEQWLGMWYASLQKSGFDRKQVLMYPMDESYDNPILEMTEYEALRITASAMKRISNDYQVLANPVAFHRSDREYIQSLVGVVDVWQPIQRLYNEGVTNWPRPFGETDKQYFRDWFTSLKDEGTTLWSFQCDGPMKTLDVNGYYRQFAWRAWGEGMTGLGIWSYNDVRGESSWNDFDGPAADFSMVYERRDAPEALADTPEPLIPSRRWRAWRAGIQDYMLLSQVRDAGAASGAEIASLVDDVRRSKNNPETYRAAVKKLHESLHKTP